MRRTLFLLSMVTFMLVAADFSVAGWCQDPAVDAGIESKKTSSNGLNQDEPVSPILVQDDQSSERQDRMKKLAKYLTKTRWTGQFTVTGVDSKPAAPEYYEIIEATKNEEGDFWNLVARIKYGENDTTLPLPPIEIKWAGETPVITVDRVTIPGMGTFDARVLIRQGQYAGTWSHDKVGGHMFGKIEKIEPAEK